MSLLARVKAAQDECAVGTCHEPRAADAELCGSAGNGHLTDYWQGRLDRTPDGSFVWAAGPQAREQEEPLSPFVRQARAGLLRAKAVA